MPVLIDGPREELLVDEPRPELDDEIDELLILLLELRDGLLSDEPRRDELELIDDDDEPRYDDELIDPRCDELLELMLDAGPRFDDA